MKDTPVDENLEFVHKNERSLLKRPIGGLLGRALTDCEKNCTNQIARSIAGINIDLHSPRELMFYRDKFAKDLGEEPWFEGEWADLADK